MTKQNVVTRQAADSDSSLQTAILGGGCFWCVEAIFTELQGVHEAISGYSGGTEETANYRDVCSKATDHIEVVAVRFDPKVVTYEEILKVFFTTHNPTTPNRQGNDRGPQYRSAVFTVNDEQAAVAKQVKENFAPTIWDDPIVTDLLPFDTFYVAEANHQDYYAKVGDRNPYCTAVISPKVSKFRKEFKDKLKARVG